MFQFINMTKQIGSFVLKDITMELADGYIMGLIGPNGAGKTSLISVLLGLYVPDAGRVLVDGKSYETEEKEIRQCVGAVLQESLFDEGMTLLQNSTYYGKHYREYEEGKLLERLQQFHLSPDQKYQKLSKGEQLKFQFAFALSHNPKLLVLDEPTANFDPEFREEFFQIIKAFIADGAHSVLLSTHQMTELERFADYITYINHGKILLSQDIETIRSQYKLLVGEEYKLNLLPKEAIVYMEKREFGTRALVRHRKRYVYDASLTVMTPTVEELMYFMEKGKWYERADDVS